MKQAYPYQKYPCSTALTISALFFALGAPLAHAQTSDQSDQPVAVVEGTPVSGQEYQEYLTTYVRSQLYHGGSPARVGTSTTDHQGRLATQAMLKTSVAQAVSSRVWISLG